MLGQVQTGRPGIRKIQHSMLNTRDCLPQLEAAIGPMAADLEVTTDCHVGEDLQKVHS